MSLNSLDLKNWWVNLEDKENDQWEIEIRACAEGKWVSESCTTTNNPEIWEVLVHLLQDRADAVVRLTAAAALRECVDCIDFDPNIFAPFLPNAITELISLMSEADTLESKRRVDQSLNTVIVQSVFCSSRVNFNLSD